MINNQYGYISLFTGAGGLDIGLEKAGFLNKLCIENNKICKETLKMNRPDWKISEPGDINQLTSRDIIKQSGLKKRKVEMIVGGPPCQPFSKAAYWHNGDSLRLNDDRSSTFLQYLRIINDLLPKIIVFENVKGFIYKNKDEAYHYFQKTIKKINRENKVNYTPVVFVINCADYGVPQWRERLFIIAHRDGLKFEIPSPVYGDTCQEKHFTAWDAIGDIDTDIWPDNLKLTGKWSDLFPSIPEGKNYLWHTPKGGGLPIFGYRTRYWNFLLKLSKHNPSWTIPAQPGPSTGPMHWKNRKLSIREICRFQTIPDEWKISGNYREAFNQVGNAVPSLIGEMLGKEIKKQFYKEAVDDNYQLLPVKRKLNAKKQRRRPVPNKYYQYLDAHSEHPGVGKGPGAIKRSIRKK